MFKGVSSFQTSKYDNQVLVRDFICLVTTLSGFIKTFPTAQKYSDIEAQTSSQLLFCPDLPSLSFLPLQLDVEEKGKETTRKEDGLFSISPQLIFPPALLNFSL